MAKRDLSSLVNGIIGNDNATQNNSPNPDMKRSVGRPKKDSSKEEVRATFVGDKNIMRKLKFIAVADDCLLKDIINKSFEKYIVEWEKERGEINLP